MKLYIYQAYDIVGIVQAISKERAIELFKKRSEDKDNFFYYDNDTCVDELKPISGEGIMY